MLLHDVAAPFLWNVICRIADWDELNGEIAARSRRKYFSSFFGWCSRVLRPNSNSPDTGCLILQRSLDPISVFGPAGSGKTTTLFQVAYVLQLLKLPTLYLPDGAWTSEILVLLEHRRFTFNLLSPFAFRQKAGSGTRF